MAPFTHIFLMALTTVTVALCIYPSIWLTEFVTVFAVGFTRLRYHPTCGVDCTGNWLKVTRIYTRSVFTGMIQNKVFRYLTHQFFICIAMGANAFALIAKQAIARNMQATRPEPTLFGFLNLTPKLHAAASSVEVHGCQPWEA